MRCLVVKWFVLCTVLSLVPYLPFYKTKIGNVVVPAAKRWTLDCTWHTWLWGDVSAIALQTPGYQE